MFLPVVSRSVVKHFFGSFSKVEVSASVGDSKTRRLQTPQANFLKKQFGYINDSFQFFLNTEIEFDFAPNTGQHFFSSVSTYFFYRVSYLANKQLRCLQKQTRKFSAYV